jgi:general secretion pathway protein L
MPILKNVLGLDLGSQCLKAVELRQTLRGLETVQLRSLPRPDPDTPLAELVAGFVALYGFDTESVVTALPGDRISMHRLEFPFSERRKIAQGVPFEVEHDLPFDLEEFVVDWAVVGGERARTEVLAALARRTAVSDLLETLGTAGCEPRVLEAEGLVLGNLTAAFDLPGPRLLVDLGHRRTRFCLLLEGRAVAARTVALGGLALTEGLAKDRDLSPEEAEVAKCEEGLLGPGTIVRSPEAGAVLDRIAREVVRTLAALEPILVRHGPDPVRELTLFGGTAQLDRIDAYLAERTGIPAARLGLPSEGAPRGLVAGGDPVRYAPAIALALRGTARARTRMNFRREEFAVRLDLGRYGRDFGLTGVLAAVALLLSIVSFGVATTLDARRARDIEREIGRLYSEALPGPVPTSAVRGLADAVRTANERAEFLGVYRGNLSALDVLTEISARVPPDLEIVLEELSIDRQTVRMRVYAKSFEAADRLGAELAKFPPFAQARIGAIETDRKLGGKRFNVTISLAPPEERT